MDNHNKRFALQDKTVLKDRYRIDGILGSNGLSITYEAFDTFREQRIVIKELYPAAVVERNQNDKLTVSCIKMIHENDFKQMKEHVIKEAKMLIKMFPLQGIANVITFFEENQTVYVVMEYVEGLALPDYMAKKLHNSVVLLKDAYKLLKPVIDSLSKLHAKGVVHGKINPTLVCVKEDGNAVLMGFCDPMEDASLAIADEATARVPGYAPVEQYVDQGGFGPATDVYAIAAIFYELSCGHKVPAFYERINEENPEGRDPMLPPAYYNGKIMDYQSKAIMKALSIYHFDRYQKLDEFVDAISEEEFTKDDRIVMREKPVKFAARVRHNKLMTWGAAISLIVLLVFLTPKFVEHFTGTTAKSFYTKLEKADLYQMCEMVTGLSEHERASLANDYNQMEEEGEHTIRYYDKVTKRFATYEQIDESGALVRYMSLDYRLNNTAVVTFVEDGMKREVIIILQPDQTGVYHVTESISGAKEGNGVFEHVVSK